MHLSLVEEVARQAVCSAATDAEMSSLPRYASGTMTWLSILHRFEHLLVFDVLLGGHIEHRNGDLSMVHCTTGDHVCSATSCYAMASGSHYAEFQITGTPYIGIVRPMPDLDAGAYRPDEGLWFDSDLYPDFLAERSDDWVNGDVHACEYTSMGGHLDWTNWDDETNFVLDWEGSEGCGTGDTIGMMLNLNEGTLTVYKNNRRLGVMKDGLSGPYCWFVTLSGNDEVTIQRGTCPAMNDV